MEKILLLLSSVLLVSAFDGVNDDQHFYPKVCLDQANYCMVGVLMQAVNRSLINAFLGIPYAKPPLGPLRFRDPEPFPRKHPDDKAVLMAMVERPSCIQWRFRWDNQMYGEEDCLYLNVYRKPDATNLPVIVELMDRDFEYGEATPTWIGPELMFCCEDVVLVTVASRLSIFGYLRFEFSNLTIHGNMGLKDQQLALKWVYENIAGFGGDPNRITLAGEAAASYHMVNAESQKYFKSVILRYTNFISPYNRPWENKAKDRDAYHPYLQDQILASGIILDPTDANRFLTTPYYVLMNRIYTFDKLLYRTVPPFRFKPVLDGDFGSPNPFLQRHPITIWKDKTTTFKGKILVMTVTAPSFDFMGYNLKDKYHIFNKEGRTKAGVKARKNSLLQAKFFNTEWDTYLQQTNITKFYFPFLDFKDIQFQGNNMKQYLEMLNFGIYEYALLKMLQGRNTAQNDTIIRFNNQRMDYRTFRSIYINERLYNDPVYNLENALTEFTARGDDYLFTYIHVYYFVAPNLMQRATKPTMKLITNFLYGRDVLDGRTDIPSIGCQIPVDDGSNMIDLSHCDLIDYYLHCDPSKENTRDCKEFVTVYKDKHDFSTEYPFWNPFMLDVTKLRKYFK